MVLRSGLLEGVAVVVASPAASAHAAAVASRCRHLGAQVGELPVDPFGDEPDPPAAVDVLVWDGAGAFASEAGVRAVRAALDGAWLAARPAANAAMIPDERGGKIVLIAPPPGDAHAEAARAGLENLARVASIEWARFGVTIVAIHPSAVTPPDDVAELVAYLASPGGDYASGCVFALR